MDSLGIDQFVRILEEFGFNLISYWVHAFKAKECGTETKGMSNVIAKNYYGACWYGAQFFEFLITDSLEKMREDSIVVPNRIYIGYVLLTTEEHHFTLIVGDQYAYVLNTYGGSDALFVNKIMIDTFNRLITQVSDIDIFEQVFGFTPHNGGKYIEHNLEEYPLILPSLEMIKSKLKLIKAKLVLAEDRDAFTKLEYDIVEYIHYNI